MSEHWHGHAGDMGDLCLGLPTIKALAATRGPATLYLFTHVGKTTQHMTPERFNFLAPLLKSQPYIANVIHDGDDRKHDSALNGFRDHKAANLADKHLSTHGLPWWHRKAAWLEVEPRFQADVVFARSKRYHNDDFPWKRAVELYGKRAVFIGLESEHTDFCKAFGEVRHWKFSDALDMASVIAGSKLLIVNQTLAHAIAEGLKHPTILEVFPSMSNCVFHRFNKIHATGQEIEWPEL